MTEQFSLSISTRARSCTQEELTEGSTAEPEEKLPPPEPLQCILLTKINTVPPVKGETFTRRSSSTVAEQDFYCYGAIN